MSDIKRAQHLSIRMSAIDNSIPHRSVRSIVRGDVYHTGDDSEDGRHRKRRYLVATDLSEESVYALEWTIGTILRDGDTIIAVYAKEKEGVKDGETKGQDGGSPEEEATTPPEPPNANVHSPRGFFGRFGGGGAATADNNKAHHHHHHHHNNNHHQRHHHNHHHHDAKAETERVRAVETITQTCVRLLRKTLLQVQIAVEVIHCKSPRHLITEAVSMSIISTGINSKMC